MQASRQRAETSRRSIIAFPPRTDRGSTIVAGMMLFARGDTGAKKLRWWALGPSRSSASQMFRHGIALVGLETVARAIQRQRAHQPVARHLGDDRGRRDRHHDAVAADHGVAVAGRVDPVAAVDEDMLRHFRQRLHGARQRPERGAQDIVAIDPRRRGKGDRKRRGRADLLEQFLAALRRQPLRIVDAFRDALRDRAPRRPPPPGPPAGRARPRRSRPPARRRA